MPNSSSSAMSSSGVMRHTAVGVRSSATVRDAKPTPAKRGTMTEQNLHDQDAYEIADAVRAKELSSAEVLEHYLGRIERLEPLLNAICDIDVDAARAQARAIDDRIA